MNPGTWHHIGGFISHPTGRTCPGAPYLLRPWRRRRRVELEFFLGTPVKNETGFWIDESKALTYELDGLYYQPDRHGFSDSWLSIPEPLQGIIPAGYAPASAALHDSGCVQHGLYTSPRLDGLFLFTPMSSARLHAMMEEMVFAERGERWAARAIGAAVRTLGPRWTWEDLPWN